MPVLKTTLFQLIAALIAAPPQTQADVQRVTGLALPSGEKHGCTTFYEIGAVHLADATLTKVQFVDSQCGERNFGSWMRFEVAEPCVDRASLERRFGRMQTLGEWARAHGDPNPPPDSLRTLDRLEAQGRFDFDMSENGACLVEFWAQARPVTYRPAPR